MKIAFLVYHDITALDLFGPLDIFNRVTSWKTMLVSCTSGPIKIGQGIHIEPAEILTENSRFDAFVIPGGFGQIDFSYNPDNLRIIRSVCLNSKFVLTVCTGSVILGLCGLLIGKKVTTNRSAFDILTRLGATVISERTVEDGNFLTCGGVSAGIDLAFMFVRKYAGHAEARRIQAEIEYNPQPLYVYQTLEDDIQLQEVLKRQSGKVNSIRQAQVDYFINASGN
ncbi:cyclohexyl-isocyanide hydratase [Dyadobacter koreensis]|uniref:Cyclohexyl-isocyanide hydratase n=1 Tax=Dyadobacter koreensis TaxID=408657 RepID=A0A1H6Y5E9_9BACT|nr:DJ-1/PfpI family protein [Dyadobacter koreensis]SEJ34257.1 cyclohexyl-isocyanide hydratase [Dyadobacter koreensis]